MQVFVIINNVGMMVNVDANIKNWFDKDVCDRRYIWTLSNYECEYDKSCDVGECLDYKNCKCRKKLVDKLVEECNEIVEEVKIVGKNEDKRSSCILYIVLFSIFFTINIGTATYFVYYKYMNHNKENLSKPDYVYPGKKSLI